MNRIRKRADDENTAVEGAILSILKNHRIGKQTAFLSRDQLHIQLQKNLNIQISNIHLEAILITLCKQNKIARRDFADDVDASLGFYNITNS